MAGYFGWSLGVKSEEESGRNMGANMGGNLVTEGWERNVIKSPVGVACNANYFVVCDAIVLNHLFYCYSIVTMLLLCIYNEWYCVLFYFYCIISPT